MKGFGLSVDDSARAIRHWQQLTRIAFTEIKIDQSFVANAALQQSARIILESSLDMAKKLGIRRSPKGRDANHWDLVRQLGCELAQAILSPDRRGQ